MTPRSLLTRVMWCGALGVGCGPEAAHHDGEYPLPSGTATAVRTPNSTSSTSSRQSQPGAATSGTPTTTRARPRIVALEHGKPHCGLADDGSLWCWFDRLERSDFSLRGVTQIASGGNHECAIAEGLLSCWGNNAYGALGDGTEVNRTAPTPVVGLGPVAEVGLTFGRSCARSLDGEVTCWGDRVFGSVGDGSRIDNSGREKLLAGTAIVKNAVSLAVASSHACALERGGTVTCWGNNLLGESGQPSGQHVLRPTRVPALRNVRLLAAGGQHTCVVGPAPDRNLRCWGPASQDGLIPAGSPEGSRHPAPYTIAFPAPIESVAVGGSSACAVLSDHSVYCLGNNENGRLGDGTEKTRTTPTRVALPEPIAEITCDALGTSCARSAQGRVWCWGKEVKPGSGTLLDDSSVPYEPAF